MSPCTRGTSSSFFHSLHAALRVLFCSQHRQRSLRRCRAAHSVIDQIGSGPRSPVGGGGDEQHRSGRGQLPEQRRVKVIEGERTRKDRGKRFAAGKCGRSTVPLGTLASRARARAQAAAGSQLARCSLAFRAPRFVNVKHLIAFAFTGSIRISNHQLAAALAAETASLI